MSRGSFGAVIAAALAGLLLTASTANASALLTPVTEAQIESWLGQGDLAFGNLFTKASTLDTTAMWHDAVDGRGPTVSLMSVTDSTGNSYVIGGYNPQSWDSSGSYHVTVSDASRTAFIFNLTTGLVLNQKPANFADVNCSQGAPPPNTPNCGKFQTLNYTLYGPTFGAGYDLNVGFDLNGNVETGLLNAGMVEAYSYGTGLVFYGDPGLLPQNRQTCGLNCGVVSFRVNALETYSIGPVSPVPEPAGVGLLAVGLLGISATRRFLPKSTSEERRTPSQTAGEAVGPFF